MNVHARELADGFDLEHLTAEFYANPYPTYRALRESEPVKRMRNGSYFLTRYDDLVTAYKNTKAYSSDKKKEFAPKYGDTPLYEHHTTSLVFNDPPAHTRVRRLIMRSERENEPTFNCPASQPTARCTMVTSSVSPERAETMVPKFAALPAASAACVSVIVPA